MPKYRVTLSDGRTFEIEANSQPSEADVMAHLGQSSEAAAPKPTPTHPMARFGQMVTDALPVIAGAGGAMLGGVPGAALGAAGGEAWKQNLNRLQGREAPATATGAAQDIGTAGVVSGALQGAGQLAGAGVRAVANTAPVRAAVAEAGPMLKEGARMLLGNERVATAGRINDALGRILGRILDAEKPAANAGGKLVKPAGSTKPDAVIREALQDLRAPTRATAGTLPPEPTLPPGYTPRASGPPPQAAVNRLRVSAEPAPAAPATEPMPSMGPGAYAGPPTAQTPAAAPAAAAAAPARTSMGPANYFLKADAAPAVATDAAEGALPEAWQRLATPPTVHRAPAVNRAVRVDPETTAMAQSLLTERGIAPAEAIKMVRGNRALPADVRAKLITALHALEAR